MQYFLSGRAIWALLSLFFQFHVSSQNALNVELFGHVNRGDLRYSGSWAYVAPGGSEYALIGAKTGTAAYPIADPGNLVEAGFVPGPETNWREITIIGNHAFVVTDAQGSGHSMQVIDLGYLPDSLHLVTSYTATFTDGHIIQKAIDSDEPYVYVMGTSTTQGVHILDVSDPANPVQVGLYAPGVYIHDAHIRGNRLYACAFYETQVHIVDISDKTNPVQIGVINYDGDNTHSASSTEDGKFLIVADEADGYPARIFNVEDLDNVVEVSNFSSNLASLVHNPYVRGDFCFVSHNTEGLRVYDISDPAVPTETGFYDTWGGASGGFNGLWSACPYFPSGKIIGGNRHDGLYIWTFNDARAARIYGVVKDADSGTPLPSASFEITQLSETFPVNLAGGFKKGVLEGSYNLVFSAPGYFTELVALNVSQGDSIWVEVALEKSFGASSVPVLVEGSVFPNPATEQVTFDLQQVPDATRIEVFDAAGRLVSGSPVTGIRHTIFTKDWESGVYWLKILDGEGKLRAVGKFSKA